MAIHELDELAAPSGKPWRSACDHCWYQTGNSCACGSSAPALAGDCEETCVRIDIPSPSGGVIFAQLVVQHVGDDVVAVRFPDGYEGLARVVGMPFEAQAAWEGYLEIMGRMAFAKLDR